MSKHKSNTPQHIAYLCLQSTREGTAGFAHVHEIVNGLRDRGWSVDLYEPAYVCGDHEPTVIKRLVEFVRVQTQFLNRFIGVKAVYLRWHFALFPITLFCKFFKIPTIIEVNGPYDDLIIAWPVLRKCTFIFKWLMKTQLLLADVVIAVTENLKDWLIQEGVIKPVYVIPNGANTDRFFPNAEIKHHFPKPYVVFFGALAEWQGIDTLLEAVDTEYWPDGLSLVIAGDGVKRPLVESYVNRNNNIRYMGRLPYSEIPGIIAGSCIGISAQNNIWGRSDTGLYPLKLFEMLACGVPVVVTHFPGQADLVRQHQCGKVIPPDDPVILAKAVAYLYDHPSERAEMGERGWRAVHRDHSWDNRAGATELILLTVL